MMNPRITAQQLQLNEAELSLCRSALYEALALGFLPPTKERVNRLSTEAQNHALAEIASILDADARSRKGTSLASRVGQLMRCPDGQNIDELEASYRYLFGHTGRPKAPPYETVYGEETLFQQPQELADIAGFFSAFGLTVNTEAHERVDHISCECEFLCFLTRKEAYALEPVERAASPFQNDASTLEETRKAQRLFLKDHLGRFAPAFSNLLNREDPNGFYGILGRLCFDFVQSECARYQVPMGVASLRLRSTALMDACFTCGSGEELIQITQPSVSIPNRSTDNEYKIT
jgi:putative dimethyl sulfoxide reductase chaperone